MSVIQQVYLAESGSSIYIKGIKPDKENEYSGERILAMVHEVLGTDKCKTYLDFRPSEPTWIQFKFHKDEFDIEKLDSLTRDSGIITKDIIKQCIYGKSSKQGL